MIDAPHLRRQVCERRLSKRELAQLHERREVLELQHASHTGGVQPKRPNVARQARRRVRQASKLCVAAHVELLQAHASGDVWQRSERAPCKVEANERAHTREEVRALCRCTRIVACDSVTPQAERPERARERLQSVQSTYRVVYRVVVQCVVSDPKVLYAWAVPCELPNVAYGVVADIQAR